MKSFWSGLTERERLLICAGAVVVVTLLIYALVLNPLAERKQASLRALETERTIYYNVLDMARASKNNSATVQTASFRTTPIREAVTEASRKTGIAISRIQPDRDGDVSFWIDAANTGEIFDWLLLLEQEFGRQVKRISIQKNTGEETLRGQFEFEGEHQ
jgi:type II secretory pathway component PulM